MQRRSQLNRKHLRELLHENTSSGELLYKVQRSSCQYSSILTAVSRVCAAEELHSQLAEQPHSCASMLNRNYGVAASDQVASTSNCSCQRFGLQPDSGEQ